MIQGGGFAGFSRETLLLLNNLVFTIMAAMVLTGTLYPLLIDALGAGKISVGPPYFGFLFAWLLVPIVIAIPIGIYVRWQEDSAQRVLPKLMWPLLIALIVGAGSWLLEPSMGWLAAIGIAGGTWVIAGSLFYVGTIVTRKGRPNLPASVLAMTLAHLGLGVFIIGVSLTGAISTEKHLRMTAGDQYSTAGYSFEFNGTQRVKGPNYTAEEGEFIVTKDGQEITRLYPQKRSYAQGGNTMTEAALDPGFLRDLYVSLGEPLDQNSSAWAVRIYHKPFIRWIWLGSIMMTMGGLLAATNKRYRRKIRVSKAQANAAQGAKA
jgi:cytochrome c-type biogenesis protein CcmF